MYDWPRINRYKPWLIIKEKMKMAGKKGKQIQKKGISKKKCNTCGLDDRKTSECFTKSVEFMVTDV